MTDPVQYEFYAPWPLFGKKLSNQWGESRQNSEIMAVLAQAAGLDLDDPLKQSDLMSWELGQHDFHNRFRLIYDDVTTKFKIQRNTGTESEPFWVDTLLIDYENADVQVIGTFSATGFYPGLNRVELFGLNKIQPDSFYNVQTLYFSSDDGFYFTTGPNGQPVVRLSDRVTGGGAGGGGLSSIAVRSTVSSSTYNTDTIIFDKDDFYISPSSTGKPIISLNAEAGGVAGISNVTFVSGDNVFFDDKLSFNPNTFYLTGTSDGSPQVNLENVLLQDTSVPAIGPGGSTLLELHSTGTFSDASGASGFTLSDAEGNVYLFFATGHGGPGLEDARNFHIYEPGTLITGGSNTNRFNIIGPGFGKAGISGGTPSPVTNQLTLLPDGKITMGGDSILYSDYTYKLTTGGSVSATSFYITNKQGSPIGARELKLTEVTTTDLDGTLVPTDFNPNSLIFNRRDFYLTRSSSGDPVVNLAEAATTGIGDPTIVSGVVKQQFSESVEWVFNHNLDSKPLLWGAYDNGFSAIIPDKLDVSNENTAYFYFVEPTAGHALLSSGRVSVEHPGFYGIGIRDTANIKGYNGIKIISFNSNDFYLHQTSENTDEAIVNFKDRVPDNEITISDNVHAIRDDYVNLNPTDFYLSQSKDSRPVINLIEKHIPFSYSHIVVPGDFRSSVTFGIPQTAYSIGFSYQGKPFLAASDVLELRLNGISGTAYNSTSVAFTAAGGTVLVAGSGVGVDGMVLTETSSETVFQGKLINYRSTDLKKDMCGNGFAVIGGTAAEVRTYSFGGVLSDTSVAFKPVTSVTFIMVGGSLFQVGSTFRVWGETFDGL